MTKLFNTRAFAGALAAALTLSAGAALADSAAPDIAVRYDDLNLSRPDGAAALFERINAAAQRACGGAPYLADLAAMESFRACHAAAVRQTVAKVNAPLLSALLDQASVPTRVAAR